MYKKAKSSHGDLGTFTIRVQHAQNHTMQGRITWLEGKQTVAFRSLWEMVKLIINAIEISGRAEEEMKDNDPAWFDKK